MPGSLSWLFALCGLTLAFGCSGGSSSSSPPSGDPALDAGVERAAKSPLRLWIYEGSLGGGPPVPLAGAVVAFDSPDGERSEKLTDVEGAVTFEADFSGGGRRLPRLPKTMSSRRFSTGPG